MWQTVLRVNMEMMVVVVAWSVIAAVSVVMDLPLVTVLAVMLDLVCT